MSIISLWRIFDQTLLKILPGVKKDIGRKHAAERFLENPSRGITRTLEENMQLNAQTGNLQLWLVGSFNCDHDLFSRHS